MRPVVFDIAFEESTIVASTPALWHIHITYIHIWPQHVALQLLCLGIAGSWCYVYKVPEEISSNSKPLPQLHHTLFNLNNTSEWKAKIYGPQFDGRPEFSERAAWSHIVLFVRPFTSIAAFRLYPIGTLLVLDITNFSLAASEPKITKKSLPGVVRFGSFHTSSTESCICTFCGCHAHTYHQRFCTSQM